MINHVRTLLLNQDGTVVPPPGCPGEEYVPPLFRRLPLSGPLSQVHGMLLSSRTQPERAFLNYRLGQYLRLLHHPDLEGWTLGTDRRVTYTTGVARDRAWDRSFFDQLSQPPQIQQVNGGAPLSFYLQTPAALTSGQRLQLSWTLTVLDSSHIELRYYDDQGDLQTPTLSYPTSAGLGGPVGLPGTSHGDNLGWSARFAPVDDASWVVQALARPQESLETIRQRLVILLEGRAGEELFGTALEEPWRSFQALWQRHPVPLLRLGGVLLALVWRLDEQRTGGSP